MMRLTSRGQELFGGETGMEIGIDDLRAVMSGWSYHDLHDAETGEPKPLELVEHHDCIRFNGETVAKSDEE